MFSFHKPKVYRSSTGCCICKAKSSSSRFTDSRKYEQDFLQCFQLAAPRQGEICNACVLLVKRWKKLPAGSQRNWRHVVDARAGPGMKSMVKCKSRSRSNGANCNVVVPVVEKENGATVREEETRTIPSRTRRKSIKKRTKSTGLSVSSFLDMTFWRREYVCCGVVFTGPSGELLVDPRFLKRCGGHSVVEKPPTPEVLPPEPHKLKSFSDSSSDSGYDESSNQGTATIH